MIPGVSSLVSLTVGVEVRSLGLDVGDRRTGVAISDGRGILATPLTVLASTGESALMEEVLTLVKQHKVECIVVGLPRRLSGDLGRQAGKVTAFAEKLSCLAKEKCLNQLDIQLWDERLSTKAAERLKTRSGGQGVNHHFRTKKGTRSHPPAIKAEVDAIAAAFILQGFLDSRHVDDNEEP